MLDMGYDLSLVCSMLFCIDDLSNKSSSDTDTIDMITKMSRCLFPAYGSSPIGLLLERRCCFYRVSIVCSTAVDLPQYHM